MLFKCPLCFKRHWTKGKRDACYNHHRIVSLTSNIDNGFGRLPTSPIQIIDDTPTPTQSGSGNSVLDALGNIATGYVLGDMLGDIANAVGSESEPVEKSKEAEPEPAPTVTKTESSWDEPHPDDSYRSSPPAATDTSSDYSSLDGFSSLDSGSSSSSDW